MPKMLFSYFHRIMSFIINLIHTRNPVKHIVLLVKKWMLREVTGFTQSHTIFTSEAM